MLTSMLKGGKWANVSTTVCCSLDVCVVDFVEENKNENQYPFFVF